MGTSDGSIMATIMRIHIAMKDAAASGHVWPGIRIHAIDMVQPPGIAIPPDMDPHHHTVVSALAAKSRVAAAPNARSPAASWRSPASVIAPESPIVRASIVVGVMAADPGLRELELVLVAPLRHQIEPVVGAVHEIDPAPVARIGMEHSAVGRLVEEARSGQLRLARVARCVVVRRPFALQRFASERNAVVEVEVAPERRQPGEAPSHPLLVGLELREGCLGDGDEGHVAMRQVDVDTVEIVGPERAALASLVPLRREHEVIDGELTPRAEELGERRLPARALEDVRLVDPFPRQLPPLPAELVAEPGELLLLGEEGNARGDPLLVRDDGVIHDAHAFSFCCVWLASFSRMPVQPRRWRLRTSSVARPSWTRTSRVPSSCGESSIVTSVACHPVPGEAHVKTRRRPGSRTRYSPRCSTSRSPRMTMRKLPPMRTSASTTGAVMAAGHMNRRSVSGVVQAA